jgi:hypothetical protein
MKRPSRIVLTCVATTSAVTGAAFAINSVAAAATGSTVAATSPATPGLSVAKDAELQRQALLLQSQIGSLEHAVAAERLALRPSAAPSPSGGTGYAQSPVLTAAAPVALAPVPSWSPPQPVAAPVTQPPAAPVAVPSVAAPTPPPVHTSTGASGSVAGATEPSEGGSDD